MAEWSVTSSQGDDGRDLVRPAKGGTRRTEGTVMKYTVYILFSEKFRKTYVGQTNDLAKRMEAHNSGRVKSTKRYLPWMIIHTEDFKTRSEAMRREKWYKTPAGRKRISELL
jgi:putative endonuclease